jgi:hypothetical protein
MNLLDLYEMRDRRDAYQRDYDHSVSGMGKQSRADVTGEEEPSGIFTVVINGRPWKTGSSNEMFALAGRIANKHTDKKVAVKWPTGELNTVKPQGVAEGSLTEDLQADDGEYYSNSDKFFGQFEINDIDFEETSPDGMELRGYIDGVNVMAWRFKSAKKVGGWGIYDDSALSQQGVTEAKVDSDGYSMDHADSGEYDYEGDQARDQMNTIVRAARRLDGLLDDNENMPEWVQMKVTLAADYLDTAADYIESNQEPELDEGDRGRGRPPAGEQDTAPITPGRVEKTATGIRHHADASRYGGTEPDAEDDHLMSKSHISRLGKMTEPDLDEGDKIGNMDADKFDAAMARLKQLAGAGPLKTVYDPTKRVYRNIPVAVQPKK